MASQRNNRIRDVDKENHKDRETVMTDIFYYSKLEKELKKGLNKRLESTRREITGAMHLKETSFLAIVAVQIVELINSSNKCSKFMRAAHSNLQRQNNVHYYYYYYYYYYYIIEYIY